MSAGLLDETLSAGIRLIVIGFGSGRISTFVWDMGHKVPHEELLGGWVREGERKPPRRHDLSMSMPCIPNRTLGKA